MTEKTTHFGNQTVPESEKPGLVHELFERAAPTYDLMNDAMSFGIHRSWKDTMMNWLVPQNGQRLLDVAGGTGDIALRFLKRAPNARATILDLTQSMLDEGRKRADATEMAGQLDWVCGDAQALPFDAKTFDAYTISFGIRNVTRIDEALAEAFRVLKTGGRIMVLEFSRIPNPGLRWVYDQYSFNIIPPLGKIIANDRDSYQYLVESIRKFPPQEDFAKMMCTAGFENVQFRNLSLGIAALHLGWKL